MINIICLAVIVLLPAIAIVMGFEVERRSR